ncbi:UNVERIFIED_CONTAM: hypothetical protein HDU68_005754, partial [Siphonaria sp. JEL0065]
SIFILAVQTTMIYSFHHYDDPFTLNFCYAMQNYIYVLALNAELLLIDARKASVQGIKDDTSMIQNAEDEKWKEAYQDMIANAYQVESSRE